MSNPNLCPAAILNLFQNQIESCGGKVYDTYKDDRRLFTRSILQLERNVKTGDAVNGGVALRLLESTITVAPYVFRQVCSNGAIMSHSLGTFCIPINQFDVEGTREDVVEAVQECAREDVFVGNVADIRESADQGLDTIISLMTLLRTHGLTDFIGRIIPAMLQEQDGKRQGQFGSRFALMNAITSVARDEPDPKRKWDLEEMGGGVPTFEFLTHSSPEWATSSEVDSNSKLPVG